MQRRDFIKIISATSGILLVPSVLNAGDKKYYNDEYCDDNILNSWDGHKVNETDIRLKVLSYAILAANPHNKQPWLIDLKEDGTIELYVDKTRLLPQTDPIHRQIHIGQGTFLENLSISATHFGYKGKINYFPKGEYCNITIEDKPVASIKLIKNNDIKKDDLFNYILKRHTNKREYDGKAISKVDITIIKKEIIGLLDGNHEINFISENEQIQKCRDISINAMKIESLKEERDLETLEMFRFNNDEIEKYRDGFGLAQSGKTGMAKWMIETFFMSREAYMENPHTFGEESMKLTQNQVNSVNTFAWLSTKENTRVEQIKIGRIYARLQLIVTKLGLVMHPLSQVLQEYPDMHNLQKEFLDFTKTQNNETVQMFFRLGYAEDTVHSPRRNIKDMML
jgi:hypothetical protein